MLGDGWTRALKQLFVLALFSRAMAQYMHQRMTNATMIAPTSKPKSGPMHACNCAHNTGNTTLFFKCDPIDWVEVQMAMTWGNGAKPRLEVSMEILSHSSRESMIL